MSERDALAVTAPAPPAGVRNAPRKKALPKTPKLSAEHAALTRKIGAGCEAVLTALGNDTRLRLEPADEKSTLFSDPVVLTSGSGPIEFSEGTRLMRALTGIDIGTESDDDQQRWAWLQAALIGRLHNTPFAGSDSVNKATGLVASGSILMRVSVRTPHHMFSLLARALPSRWLDILSRTSWTTDRQPTASYLSIPYRSSIRIARHTMPARTLQTVAAGDIFLPSSPRFLVDGEGVLKLAGVMLRVMYIAPCALHVIEAKGKIEMDDIAEDDVGQEKPNALRELMALDAIPVTLDFEMGQIAMSLSELRATGVGSIMEITGGSPASITIASSGRILGQGEIVDVNGQLGIRITHWG